jgi:exo-beta-1,3-glucanase (GH17 family)/cellulose synthase/poly-beta-1,6-N-acetylglucosamine synthase-like glycosyltransferase
LIDNMRRVTSNPLSASGRQFIAITIVLLGMAILHIYGMASLNRPRYMPDVDQKIVSLSFTPFDQDHNPDTAIDPTPESLERDVRAAARYAKTIRVYSSTGGFDAVPPLAAKYGLSVTAGAWIDEHEERNGREISALIEISRANVNVTRLIVGNEAILFRRKTAQQMIELMAKVRHETGKPVSTAEPWNVWIDHPELVQAADFITMHVLPYWENVRAEDAVAYAFEQYDKLRKLYPHKPIYLGEFGWPSGQYRRTVSVPSMISEARVVRHFLEEARRRRIDYNLMEAFDQPWKISEGAVGAYWGIMNADRELKFPLTGPVIPDKDWLVKSILGSLLGTALALPLILRRRSRPLQILALAVIAHVCAAALVAAFATPFSTYVNAGHIIMWLISAPLVGFLVLLSFDRARELVDILLGRRERRLMVPARHDDVRPMVSIHVPACREDPEMLRETLESLSRLEYAPFEVLMIVNNTTDPALVEPVERICAELGPRFRFIHLPKISGFKAGALNHGLALTHADAEIIAVIDADYVVEPDWLADLAPAFADPVVGLVQAPQEHRAIGPALARRAMYGEYAGFFDIGMVERNEAGAIIAHGTMLLLRKQAVIDAGGWAEWCICEDTELGMRLIEAGYEARYTNHRYGAGLLPDDIRAQRSQRTRWAYGGMRILRRHLVNLLPWRRELSREQKIHFGVGWLHWIGDLAALALALLNVIWTIVMRLVEVNPPNLILTEVTLAAAVIAVLHTAILYRLRVKLGWVDIGLAAMAAMSLQFTIARACLGGLVTGSLPFVRTAKGKTGQATLAERFATIWPEIAIAAALLASSAVVWQMNWDQMPERTVFAIAMAVQSVPFLATLVMESLEAYDTARARRCKTACQAAG